MNGTNRSAGITSPSNGVDFPAIESFEWEEAVVAPDTRKQYGETRYTAIGPIGDRLHWVCFTLRGDSFRIISLRKANAREVKKWLEK
jgi:uncharacterized DUF497 family protein